MKLTKTACEMLQEAKKNKNGMVSVECGFQYGKEFGSRALNAAKELVKAGVLEQVAIHPFKEMKNGFVRMHGNQFVFRLK